MNMKRRLKKRVRKNWRVMKMFMNHLPKKKKGFIVCKQTTTRGKPRSEKLDHHQRREPTQRSPLIKRFMLQRLLKLNMLKIELTKEKISLLTDCL